MTGDGVVDNEGYALFEPLFVHCLPGASADLAVNVVDGSAGSYVEGECYESKWGRRLWQSEGCCAHTYDADFTDGVCPDGYRAEGSQCLWDVTGLSDRTGAPPPVCGDGVCEARVETCADSSCPADCGTCGLGDACLLELDCGEGACLHGRCQRLAAGSTCSAPDECVTDIGSITAGAYECASVCLDDPDCGAGICRLGLCGDGTCGRRRRTRASPCAPPRATTSSAATRCCCGASSRT